MSLPTRNDVQLVEPVLTNMLISYMQADERFVASRVFPPVPVDKDSGTIPKLTKKYWFLDQAQPRAPGAPFPQAGFAVTSDTYKVIQYAVEQKIADETRANSQFPMDLESIASRLNAQWLLIRMERMFAADFMASSVWGTTNTTATDWDDFASSDPVADIETAVRTISDNTGMGANSIVLGKIVNSALKNHPDLIDRVKYTQQATAGNMEGALAALFGLANYWVARASYNTANESATFSASPIIDDDALVCHVDPSAGLMGASSGKTFYWEPGGGMGAAYRVRQDDLHADLIQANMSIDQKAVATDLGYFFSDIV